MHTARRHGFTLVELSIVLAIIGLLIGGVLAGQSLIKSSQLKGVTNEAQQYISAIGNFKDQYRAVPGDMVNAVQYWGAAAGGTANGPDATCMALTTESTTTATCNGNGDSQISDSSGTNYYESYRGWQQLANAGLLSTTFTGIRGTSGYPMSSLPGTNVPKSKYPNAGWSLRSFGTITGNPSMFSAKYNNVITLFASGTTGDWGAAPILSAVDAQEIDRKVDDGRPDTGKVLSFRTSVYPNCVAGTNTEYNLSSGAEKACPLMFITGF